jgi:hypothetical protein
MINVLVMWLVLAAVLVGWGLLLIWGLRRSGGASFGGVLSVFQTLWLGYAGLLCFLQLLSLVLPIADIALVLSLPPAIAGFVLQRRIVRRRLRALRSRRRLLVTATCVIVLAAIVVDYVASDLVRWYDTGLYHLQAVKWIAEYGVVPGLGNLHMRFGYNNSVHVFGAYVDAYWQGMSAHVTNGFFLTAVLAQWFTEIFTARTPRGRLRQAFCLLTLPFLFTRLWTLEPSSLGTDLPTTVFAFALVLELLSLQPDSRGRQLLPLTLIMALAAVSFSTKLGGLSLFLVAAVLAVWLLRRGASWRDRLLVFALPLLIAIGWCIRGVITSGWLVYPVFGHLPLSWSVPVDVAADDLGNIQSWSRVWAKGPSEVFGHGFWHWFSQWLDVFRMSREFVLLVVACSLLAWRAAFGSANSPVRRIGEWAAIAACVLGITQWFVGAPDLRYGAFLFWSLPAVLFAPMIARPLRDVTLRPLVLASVLAVCVWGGAFAFRLDATIPKLWGRLRAPQTVEVERVSVEPGLEVFKPLTTDQCFDTALPCSPTPTSARLRRPGSLGSGFLPANR